MRVLPVDASPLPAGRAFVRAGLLLLAATGVLLAGAGCRKSQAALKVHVGGTMRPVITELAKLYEQKTGRQIEINSADSGELLAYIEGGREGDLYVCHDPYLKLLMERGLGQDAWTVAELTPVIVVRKGDTRVKSLAELADPKLTLVLTDFEHSTLGYLLPTIFRKAGIDFDPLKKRANVHTFRSGGQAANEVILNNGDAAIVWNAVAYLRRDKLDAIPIPPQHLPTPGVDAVTSATGKSYTLMPVRVTVATLTCSTHPEEAREFAEFLTSPEARNLFRENGFSLPDRPKAEYKDGRKV